MTAVFSLSFFWALLFFFCLFYFLQSTLPFNVTHFLTMKALHVSPLRLRSSSRVIIVLLVGLWLLPRLSCFSETSTSDSEETVWTLFLLDFSFRSLFVTISKVNFSFDTELFTDTNNVSQLLGKELSNNNTCNLSFKIIFIVVNWSTKSWNSLVCSVILRSSLYF